MFSITRIFLAGMLIFITGCAIGPKYVRPTTQMPAAYKEAGDWQKANPQDALIRGEWWKIFNDPRLDALEEQVNISNQNIVAAEAQYAQAYALVQAARSALFPTLSTTCWRRSCESLKRAIPR